MLLSMFFKSAASSALPPNAKMSVVCFCFLPWDFTVSLGMGFWTMCPFSFRIRAIRKSSNGSKEWQRLSEHGAVQKQNPFVQKLVHPRDVDGIAAPVQTRTLVVFAVCCFWILKRRFINVSLNFCFSIRFTFPSSRRPLPQNALARSSYSPHVPPTTLMIWPRPHYVRKAPTRSSGRIMDDWLARSKRTSIHWRLLSFFHLHLIC